MRLGTMVLAAILVAPAISAAAYESQGVDAYRSIYRDGGGVFPNRDGSIRFGNPNAQIAGEMTLLNDYNARRRAGTTQAGVLGGPGMIVGAGVVGSR